MANAAAAILMVTAVAAGVHGLGLDSLWTSSQDAGYTQSSEPYEIDLGAISEQGSEEMMLVCVGLVAVLVVLGMDRALSTDHTVYITSS